MLRLYNKTIDVIYKETLGTLRKYNPANGMDVILYEDIPFDPNHPGRQ